MTPPMQGRPELSIIIPALNEAERIPSLLKMLAGQLAVCFEVVLADGGSTDGTSDIFRTVSRQTGLPSLLVTSSPGRGVQLNAGADIARGEFFLFLHADSNFRDPEALKKALDCYRACVSSRPVAGRFRLRFEDAPPELTAEMVYWEIKAGLNRPGCTHGDQGFLITRSLFSQIGPFVEDWPIFEDTFFAEKVRGLGAWLLLPAELHTSARRFATEGLSQRATLNALLMNFREIGWKDYFKQARDVYRTQDKTGRLQLRLFLLDILVQLRQKSFAERVRLWYRTGVYVRANAWQLVLFRKVRSGRWGLATPVSEIEASLGLFDRRFGLVTDNPAGYLLTALLTRLWFSLQLRRSR